MATVARGRVGAAIMQHPGEFVAGVVALAAVATIFVNALFLQHGPHPAPIFATRPWVGASAQHRANHKAPDSRAQLIADIQRALGAKGFYKATVDGIWGAETDAAVRDFAQAAGLKLKAEASPSLLHTITASKVQATMPTQPASSDAIARLLAPSKRMLAIQRALSDFGYGQIKPTGVYDADTRAAIEKFQRDRRLPVTGQISEPTMRALATMTGRPLE